MTAKPKSQPKIHTVLLGQFTHERADAIAKELEGAGIVWWVKQAGGIAQFLFRADWGVRLFVDASKAAEVKTIVERVNKRFDDKP
ncbi:MAG: hypothetical protein NVSMB57_09180 [Actinomycetota bacterium]